ncbi:MAG: peptidase S10, partial [Chloroflexi bacterium]|nr:peptidase S10 [Chloroflexota bacterium]
MSETQGEKKDEVEKKAKDGETKPEPKDNLVVTQHQATIQGVTFPYSVTCGTIILKEESEKTGEEAGKSEGEKPKAAIFFVAYTRDDVTEPAKRPLTFAFNGGPGSSSVWLHLGVLGPRRVKLDDEGMPFPPPYELVENPYSLLDLTDLVFIDPVSTGYSRPVEGEKAREFHGFKKDIQSVGDFIRLYTSRYQRWSSPKFLIGESYGTTRASGLSGYLQDRHGMYLNGIMLISAVLNFQTLRFGPGNDLPYLLFLPTYTATAWYHHKLAPDLQERQLREVLDEVEAFAMCDYAAALLHGDALGNEQREEIIRRLAFYTGLSKEYVERTDLRLEIFRFTKELLREQRRTVGRLDSRFKGIDRDSAGEMFEHDPSLSAVLGAYTATLNDYVRRTLKFESDLPYEILTEKVWPWDYSAFQGRYVEVGETLRRALTANPAMRLFIANGYYDLATPYFATEYTFNHLGLDPSLRPNVSMEYYEAGHMMYIHLPSLQQLKD